MVADHSGTFGAAFQGGPTRGSRALAIIHIAMYDAANAILSQDLPIIYFAVLWWNTLHQGSSVSFRGTSMHVAMLWGMLLMALSFWMYAIGASMTRVRSIIVDRERRTHWVRAL